MAKKLEHTDPLTCNASFKSLKPLDLNNFSKDDVKNYFNNTYDLYETLFTSLKYDCVYYMCPDRLRLPLIFYYGHTAAVYVNKLVLAGLVKPYERINLEYETTFETGVDEMSWDDTEHYRMGGGYKWPSVKETKEFRRKVRELINKVIERTPLDIPVTMNNKWWGLFLGFEHDRIHFETSSVLIRQYPIEMVAQPFGWTYGPAKLNKNSETIVNQIIRVNETEVRLGKREEFPSFGWDNEYGLVECKVSAFEASKYKVTNEEFLEFVLENGYEKREFWSDEGWEWVQFKQARHPLFWVCPNGCKSGCGGVLASHSHCQSRLFSESELAFWSKPSEANQKTLEKIRKRVAESEDSSSDHFGYKLRLMFDVIAMPYNWPVEVNYHEAKAFCKWRGEGWRVLSEAEHHAIRDHHVDNLSTASDVIFQKNAKYNHNMAYGSSTPVDLYPANSKGFHDVFGNVWEWCEDNFNGLANTKTHFVYDDFSTPCYDGRHNIIMGGSWVSTGDEASCFARFMFRRHFYQHCGFRMSRSLPTADGSKANPQIRLVIDRIFILGETAPQNKVDLDETKIELNYFPTTNQQYLYDSHLHPEYFDDEMLFEYGQEQAGYFAALNAEISSLLSEYQVGSEIATHLGCSTARLTFELTKRFGQVIAIDFCSKFLDVALQLQSKGYLETLLTTKQNQKMQIDIKDNLSVSRAIFKQMTWIPNEIVKSDLVLFSMIDRVTNHLSWIRRLREIVRPNGLLLIHSRDGKWSGENLLPDLIAEFDLLKEVSFNGSDSFTVWKMKPEYVKEIQTFSNQNNSTF